MVLIPESKMKPKNLSAISTTGRFDIESVASTTVMNSILFYNNNISPLGKTCRCQAGIESSTSLC